MNVAQRTRVGGRHPEDSECDCFHTHFIALGPKKGRGTNV